MRRALGLILQVSCFFHVLVASGGITTVEGMMSVIEEAMTGKDMMNAEVMTNIIKPMRSCDLM